MSDLPVARIDALFIYPIKACAALKVGELSINGAGLIDGDREWAVVDEKDEVTWQGAHPRLACVQPMRSAGGLRMSVPGEVPVELPVGGPARRVKMWNDSVKQVESFTGFDAGDAAAALLRQVTGAPLRLVRFGPEALARRGVNPLHLVNAASIDELNLHLGGSAGIQAEALRFRPNLVLGHVDEPLLPFIEEQLVQVHGDGWRMPVTAPCIRCIVPGVHPTTGVVSEALPLEVAAVSAQRLPGGPSCFGVYAAPAPWSRISAGQRVGLELSF